MKSRSPRRDGFDGQRMIVLPEPVRAAARRHPLLRGLHVTDAGFFPAAAHHLVERPEGAPTTLVILCLRGSGRICVGGAARDIRAGDLAWLPAGEPHEYGAPGKNPWTIAWAHFAGEEVAAWRGLLGVAATARPAVVALPDDRLDEVALDRVGAALERGYALRHQVTAAAALRQALSMAVQLAVTSGEVRPAHDRVVASIEMLRRDWQSPHRLDELAAAAGLSVTRYSWLFRRQAGFAPIDFLIRLRMQHACRLLDTTPLPIAVVAERSGYADPYYFTRCFRRVMGCAPRAYRKVTKG